MQVVEKKHHIDVTINGNGIDLIKSAILKSYPNAIVNEDMEALEEVDWLNDIVLSPNAILKIRLENAGLNQRELSQKLGVANQVVSDLINGRRNVSKDMAVRLSKVLGGDPGEYLYGIS